MLVDSGPTERYFDDGLRLRLKDKLLICKKHDIPRNIVTAGRHVPLGTAAGTIVKAITHMNGSKQLMELTGLVVPGLGHHLFSALQANRKILATTIHSRPLWEQASQVPASIWHRRT